MERLVLSKSSCKRVEGLVLRFGEVVGVIGSGNQACNSKEGQESRV